MVWPRPSGAVGVPPLRVSHFRRVHQPTFGELVAWQMPEQPALEGEPIISGLRIVGGLFVVGSGMVLFVTNNNHFFAPMLIAGSLLILMDDWRLRNKR